MKTKQQATNEALKNNVKPKKANIPALRQWYIYCLSLKPYSVGISNKVNLNELPPRKRHKIGYFIPLVYLDSKIINKYHIDIDFAYSFKKICLNQSNHHMGFIKIGDFNKLWKGVLSFEK